MLQTVRMQKVNRPLVGKACGHCGDALALGENGALCEACRTPHHVGCWDKKMGCGGPPDCPNAPLPVINEKPIRPLKDDEMVCFHCERIIYVSAAVCPCCDQIVTVDGVYRGEKTTESRAKLSLLLAVFGFLSCITPPMSLLALVLGPLAVVNGLRAVRLIALDEKLRGNGLATVGLVLGGLDLLVCFAVISSLPPGGIYNFAYWLGYHCIPFICCVRSSSEGVLKT